MAVDPITVAKLWMAIRPIKRLKDRRKAKRNGQESPVETGGSMAGYKTYSGIVVALVGVVLGWLGVGESEAGTLAAQIGGALDQILTVGGLLFAAYGRAKAKPAA